MRLRRFTVMLMVFAFAAPASASARAFVEPSRGLSLPLPPGPWKVEEEFGDELATLRGAGTARIRVLWEERRSAERGWLLARLAALVPGARLEGVQSIELAGGGGMLASFAVEGDAPRRGALFVVPEGEGALLLLCLDAPRAFPETFLACREMASGARRQPPSPSVAPEAERALARDDPELLPTPAGLAELREALGREPQLLPASSALVRARALFAWLDGRAACPGVAEEPLRMAKAVGLPVGTAERLRALAARLGARPAAHMPLLPEHGAQAALERAMRLAREGRRESARAILEVQAKGRDGFFPLLFLAQMALEEDDRAAAAALLKRASSMTSEGRPRSRLLEALRLWEVRLAGRAPELSAIAEARFREPCGFSGAIAAYELGVARAGRDPQGAAWRFEEAIAADPAFAPAYRALGTALLDGGASPQAVRERLAALLRKAPATAEIAALREGLAAWRAPQGTRSGNTSDASLR